MIEWKEIKRFGKTSTHERPPRLFILAHFLNFGASTLRSAGLSADRWAFSSVLSTLLRFRMFTLKFVPSHRPLCQRNVNWIESASDMGIGISTNERSKSVEDAAEFVIVRHSSCDHRTVNPPGAWMRNTMPFIISRTLRFGFQISRSLRLEPF